jgi:hypothetical protein
MILMEEVLPAGLRVAPSLSLPLIPAASTADIISFQLILFFYPHPPLCSFKFMIYETAIFFRSN